MQKSKGSLMIKTVLKHDHIDEYILKIKARSIFE